MTTILKWTITFFIFALVAAVFGFSGIASAGVEIAEILFYVFLFMAVISLIVGATPR